MFSVYGTGLLTGGHGGLYTNGGGASPGLVHDLSHSLLSSLHRFMHVLFPFYSRLGKLEGMLTRGLRDGRLYLIWGEGCPSLGVTLNP